MREEDVKSGLRVEITKLGTTVGWCVNRDHLDVRLVGIKGMVGRMIPGHGGELWSIRHDNGDIGCYVYHEFERIKNICVNGFLEGKRYKIIIVNPGPSDKEYAKEFFKNWNLYTAFPLSGNMDIKFAGTDWINQFNDAFQIW